MLTGEIVLLGDGDSGQLSKGAIGMLLVGAGVLGVIGYIGSKNSHRASQPRPWAKKGVFRGLGRAAITLFGAGKRRRRRR